MAHSDPHPVFVGPVKAVIKAALVKAGLSDLDVSYNAVERNGVSGARILMSPAVPPVTNDAEKRSSGGQRKQWHGVDGKKYSRAYRHSIILTFEVDLWSESLDKTTGTMFDFLRWLPRHTFDGQAFLNDPNPPVSPVGNRIELRPVMLLLPDDTTSTGKQYKASVQVRAEGALWLDMEVGLEVETQLRIADNFA